MNRNRQEKGITLIALVITIIVLLILAGVAISTLTGDNGILTKAAHSTEEQSHTMVKEAMSLEWNTYQIEINTAEQNSTTKNIAKLATRTTIKVASIEGEETETFWGYLLNKGFIDDSGKINVQKLTGNKTKLGNGTDGTDVYILEYKDNKYLVNYYGNTTEGTSEIWNVDTTDEEPIISLNDPSIFSYTLNRRKYNSYNGNCRYLQRRPWKAIH